MISNYGKQGIGLVSTPKIVSASVKTKAWTFKAVDSKENTIKFGLYITAI